MINYSFSLKLYKDSKDVYKYVENSKNVYLML